MLWRSKPYVITEKINSYFEIYFEYGKDHDIMLRGELLEEEFSKRQDRLFLIILRLGLR